MLPLYHQLPAFPLLSPSGSYSPQHMATATVASWLNLPLPRKSLGKPAPDSFPPPLGALLSSSLKRSLASSLPAVSPASVRCYTSSDAVLCVLRLLCQSRMLSLVGRDWPHRRDRKTVCLCPTKDEGKRHQQKMQGGNSKGKGPLRGEQGELRNRRRVRNRRRGVSQGRPQEGDSREVSRCPATRGFGRTLDFILRAMGGH